MGKGSRGVSKFALVASAVRASSWRFRGPRARARTLHLRWQVVRLSVTRAVHLASGSSVPGGSSGQSIGRGVSALVVSVRCKLVMVSAVCTSSWRFPRPRGAGTDPCHIGSRRGQVERHESGAFGEGIQRPCGLGTVEVSAEVSGGSS